MISIIIPIHDSVDCFEESISSILNQNYNDLEVICITFKSNNKLISKIKDFEKRDSRIKCIVNEISNHVFISKNIGLEHSNGEYILILKPNQKINDRCLESFIDINENKNLDLLISNLDDIYEVDKKMFNKVLMNTDIDGKFLFNYLNKNYSLFIKKTFLNKNNIKFFNDDYYKHEDMFLLNCIFSATNILFNDKKWIIEIRTTKKDTKFKDLKISIFEEIIEKFLNISINENFRYEFWNYIFENIYQYFFDTRNEIKKREFFIDAKLMYDKYFLNETSYKNLSKSINNLLLEFFNQSITDVSYIPQKRDISRKLAVEDFKSITIAIKLPNQKNNNDKYYLFAVSLKKAFEKKGFDVIIHEFGKWYSKGDNEDIVIVLRGPCMYIPQEKHINVMWNISHHESIQIEEFNSFDIVFSSSEYHANLITKKVDTIIKPLLLCTDPEIFYYSENNDIFEEILFIGNENDCNKNIINDISCTFHSFFIYGMNWKNRINEKYIKEEYVVNELLNQYYSSCKILLNNNRDNSQKFDFTSTMIFDALACEALIISDNSNFIPKSFEDIVIVYDNIEDLDKKIKFYLDNDDERNKKRNAGQKQILSRHTFNHRVETIIESLKNIVF